MAEIIDYFNGKYHFLSNFHPSKVTFEEIEYSSVEHAYQAAKTLNLSMRKKIRLADSAGKAKKLGQKVDLRPNWTEIKLKVMEDLLVQKFNQSDFKKALLNTENKELIEGNWWGDTFYGICNGKGENHLGKLLMKIRDRLKTDEN